MLRYNQVRLVETRTVALSAHEETSNEVKE